MLYGATRTVMVDICVSHPTTPARMAEGLVPRSADREIPVLRRMENKKIAKYTLLARAHQASFAPFACDVYGAIGLHGQGLIGWLCGEAMACGRLSTGSELRDFRRLAYDRLSSAIQRGAAIGAADAAMRIRAAISRRVGVE